MHICPDILGRIDTGLRMDVALRFPTLPAPPARVPDKWGWLKKMRIVPNRDVLDGNRVVCGSLLSPKETKVQPEVEFRYFGREPRLHTLIMLDPGESLPRFLISTVGDSCSSLPSRA
jgi:hypothetical protein